MKKRCFLLICMVLIAVVSEVCAQGGIELLGGTNVDRAIVLNNEQFGHLVIGNYENEEKSSKQWQLEGWYSFTAPSNGICTIRVKEYDGKMSWFRLRNRDGEILEKECYGGLGGKGTWGVYTFNVKMGDVYYLNFASNNGNRKWGYMFSVCVGGRHQLGSVEQIVRKETCTEKGSMGYQCELCGEIVVSNTIPAKGHQAGHETLIQEATCLQKGMKGILCSVCGEIMSSTELPLTGHIPGAYVDVRPATCSTEGVRVQYCQTCNATMNTETVAALGHVSEEWRQVRMESCTNTGLREKRCSVCGQVLASEELPMKVHQYSEWTTTVNPTKETEGEQISACLLCGDVRRESVPKIEKFLGIF